MTCLEDVTFSVNLPGIDFIEESHHDERVEDDREVDAGRLADLQLRTVRHSEEPVT